MQRTASSAPGKRGNQRRKLRALDADGERARGLRESLGEHVPVHRGGPTIEDIVREEMRPMLKQWLDTHLQALVERQVRAEIERIVGRAVS